MRGEIKFLNVIMGWIRGTGLRENAFGSNGKKLGKSKRDHTGESITIENCTDSIITGIERNKEVIYIPKKLRLIPFLNVFFKRFLNWKVSKAVDDRQD
jgi:hypothetical protein